MRTQLMDAAIWLVAWLLLLVALVAVLPGLNLWWGTALIVVTGLVTYVLVDRLYRRRGARPRG